MYRSNGSSYGPVFGGSGDIVISNKANSNFTSYSNINNSFVNSNYKAGDK
jgi:hypothetical protein